MGTLLIPAANTVYSLYQLMSVPPSLVAALAGAGAGNVENGAHRYAVSFVTAIGESLPSEYVIVTVADKTVDGKVALSSIPLGLTGTTARKIYRTAAAGTALKLLTTLSDNTTTTYTDNTADASLSASVVPTAVDTSGLDKPLNYFRQLNIHPDDNNTDDVFVGDSDALSSLNYSKKLSVGREIAFSCDSALASNIFVLSPTAGQKIHVHGREV
jgi:hypothetical protein